MTEEEKEPYQVASKEDEERYQRENKQLNETGRFVDKDGISSVEHALKRRLFKYNVIMPKQARDALGMF